MLVGVENMIEDSKHWIGSAIFTKVLDEQRILTAHFEDIVMSNLYKLRSVCKSCSELGNLSLVAGRMDGDIDYDED